MRWVFSFVVTFGVYALVGTRILAGFDLSPFEPVTFTSSAKNKVTKKKPLAKLCSSSNYFWYLAGRRNMLLPNRMQTLQISQSYVHDNRHPISTSVSSCSTGRSSASKETSFTHVNCPTKYQK